MATNFLDAAGTNGFIQAQFNLLTTELGNGSGIANGAAVTSSVGGTSGVFTQASWSQAIWGGIQFKSGGAFTPTAGGFLAGWFLISQDGGSTFEAAIATPSATVMALGRAPDFEIPLYEGGAAWASGNIRAQQGRYIKLPWESHKILLQNLSGVTLPTSGNVLSGTGQAIQY
jgi:hypothetical protein